MFRTLSEKPWIPHPAGSEFLAKNYQKEIFIGRTALRFFISVVSVIFFLFTITFLTRSQFPDFQALAGEPWQPLSDASHLWLNTGALLISSIALHWAHVSARKNQLNGAIASVMIGAFFALLFLLGQILVWKQLIELGYYVASNPANSYFYLYTSVHGLHLLGGLFALAYVTLQLMKKNSLVTFSSSVRLCAVYWHFLLILWLFLFALLTSSTDTINIIAQLCGF
ncbi:cytochrome c oxidase subunit III [Aliikangiella coralliicola]|uniref:Cytochrome c oxidase subunit III n=1 Tax=Aliikangiella coralliicola TaxID=2592383 RepID=A0A545U824_9GAMM|nr:cytochrome c oxidase subunit III [Aliikangiella coralliicola]